MVIEGFQKVEEKKKKYALLMSPLYRRRRTDVYL